MSIGMERFGSEGRFANYDMCRTAPARVQIFQLECSSCGYEHADSVSAPRLCPKCHSDAWDRFAKPGGTLVNAERYDRI